MATCQGCGGIIGRDCFNPTECLWISQQQQQDNGEQYRNEIWELKNELSIRERHINALEEQLKALQSTPSPSRGFTEEEMEGKIQEIGKKYFQCDCGEVYLSRKLTAPDCLYHTSCWYEALTELAASLPQSKVEGDGWVSADTPPENERAVIVVGKFGKVLQTLNDMAYYKNGKWYDNSNDLGLVPTFIKYWKEKPAPPKQ